MGWVAGYSRQSTRDEAEVISRGQTMNKLGLQEMIKLFLMITINNSDSH